MESCWMWNGRGGRVIQWYVCGKGERQNNDGENEQCMGMGKEKRKRNYDIGYGTMMLDMGPENNRLNSGKNLTKSKNI